MTQRGVIFSSRGRAAYDLPGSPLVSAVKSDAAAALPAYEARMAVCRACPERRDLPKGLLQCKQCGCIINAKARCPGAKCPLDKW